MAFEHESYPNTAPPGYVLCPGSPWGGQQARRVSNGQPSEAPVPLADAWRSHRRWVAVQVTQQHAAPIDPVERQALTASAELRPAPFPRRPDPVAVTSAPDSQRRAALVGYILAHFTKSSRGWSETTAANLLDVHRRTLDRWASDRGVLAAALAPPPVCAPLPEGARPAGNQRRYFDTDYLERVVAFLAVAPVVPKGLTAAPPVVPAALRLRTTAGVLRLEMRTNNAGIVALTEWAEREGAKTSPTLTRLLVEGPEHLLKALRAALLGLERWQTLTPSAADVDMWIGWDPAAAPVEVAS